MRNLKTITNKLLILILIPLSLISCGDDETPSKGAYENGVLILNEGNFGTGNASVTHYNIQDGIVTDNIYNTVTNNSLGDVAQSIYISDDRAYVVVNNSNKVEVINSNTFEMDFTIDAELPRYFTILNDKGYLTEWVSFTEMGRVSVIDLTDGTSQTTIPTGFGAENIIAANGKLYVSNNFQNDISVINPNTNEVVSTITVGFAPGGFEIDSNGDLWVICGGGFDANFTPLNNGALYKINTSDNSVISSIDLEANIPIKIAMSPSRNTIYYYSGNKVYQMSINDTSKPSSAFITEDAAIGFYGIGVNPSTGNIYMGDAKGFQGNGTVFRYTSAGTTIDNFTVGIAPNGFVFR